MPNTISIKQSILLQITWLHPSIKCNHFRFCEKSVWYHSFLLIHLQNPIWLTSLSHLFMNSVKTLLTDCKSHSHNETLTTNIGRNVEIKFKVFKCFSVLIIENINHDDYKRKKINKLQLFKKIIYIRTDIYCLFVWDWLIDWLFWLPSRNFSFLLAVCV